jgi:DMSO reductase family type II enzyme heme b subunit
MMPLWTGVGSVEQVTASALWDDDEIAVMLVWRDRTPDEGGSISRYSDAAAIQISGEQNPPFFGMGDPDRPCQIWHWKASWEADRAAFVDANRVGGAVMDLEDDTELPAVAAGNSLSRRDRGDRAEELMAAQFGSLTPSLDARDDLRAVSGRAGDGWRLILRHPRRPRHAGDVAFEPGKRVSISFAVWDGAISERNGQKSVTVWHALELAP